MEDHDQVLLSSQVHHHGTPGPRWYAGLSARQWWIIISIPNNKWDEARVCPSPYPLQHHVFCYAQGRLSWMSRRYQHHVQVWWWRRFQSELLTSQRHTMRRSVNSFADDCALTTGSEAEMQSSFNKFASAFCLTISTRKTEVLYQPSPGVSYKQPHIKFGDFGLNWMLAPLSHILGAQSPGTAQLTAKGM